MTSPVLTTRTKALYAAILAAFLIVFLEAASWIGIALLSPRLSEPIRRTPAIFRDQSERIRRWLEADSSTLFVIFDSSLGWRQRPGYRSALYTVGPQGLRGSRVYGAVPARGVLRVDAFGDSFVFGSEVGDTAAWPAIIEKTFPGIEVPNYGVGGYGLDQTFLSLAAHGRDLHPKVVVVGYVPDDLRRAVNVYRRFLSTSEPPLVKPRFVLGDSESLTLVPAPLKNAQDYRRVLDHPRDALALGRLDYWYSPLIYQNPLYDYSAAVRLVTTLWVRISRQHFGDRLYIGAYANPRAEAFRLQVALFDHAADSIRAMGAQPLFVFFPDREQMTRIIGGGRPSYQPLLDTLRAHGLNPLDAAAAFAKSPAADLGRWFMTAHYSPEGNRLVALWLGGILKGKGGPGTSSPN